MRALSNAVIRAIRQRRGRGGNSEAPDHRISHWVSPKYLDAYVAEMTVRYNTRDETSGERANDLMSRMEGPFAYKVLIA